MNVWLDENLIDFISLLSQKRQLSKSSVMQELLVNGVKEMIRKYEITGQAD